MSMNDLRRFCRSARPRRRVVRSLLVTGLLVMCGGVLVPANAADQTTGTPELLQRQGQQKQRLIQGQAATQLSQREAKRLAASAPSPALSQQSSSPQQPVSEADVQRRRAERIRRLNAAKVAPALTP
ncbi:MAG TPA: hypothetical protein VIM63_04810 [Rhodoferax sp.]